MLRVLFFASLRDEMGCAKLELSCPRDLGELFGILTERYGVEKVNRLKDEDVLVAHNQKVRRGNIRLCSGDEIAFLPPVTGG